MKTVDLEERVGADKLLRLTIPVDEANRTYHVSVVIHEEQDDEEWSESFFEETSGQLSNDFVVEPEGEPEERQTL